jgi:hypothetical protein
MKVKGWTWRDELVMQVLGFRQCVYDLPDSKVPEVAALLDKTEKALKEMYATSTQKAGPKT